MSVAGIAALAVTGLLVAALAVSLIWVLLILHRLVDTLGKVTFGVGAIGHRLSPVAAVIEEINTDLVGVAAAMEEFALDAERRAGGVVP